MISLKGQILFERARRLNVPWEKTKQNKNIVSLLPFVARRFQSSVSGLSGPPILALPSPSPTTPPPPPPNTPHQPCLAPSGWELHPAVFVFKIRLQRKQIPQGTKNGLEALRSCSQTFGKHWTETLKESQGDWSPGIFIKKCVGGGVEIPES